MASYKFRITFEDYDDVSRDIEIKPSQTFLDLHHCILKAINFDNELPASFYMSNDKWLKGTEIALHPRMLKDGTEVKTMDAAVMNKFIYDPHQKIYYMIGDWCFYVELIKINTATTTDILPKCVKVIGEPPKQYKATKLLPGVSELNNLETPDDDLEPDMDDIAEATAIDVPQAEGLDEGEGEEGFGIEGDEADMMDDDTDMPFADTHDDEV